MLIWLFNLLYCPEPLLDGGSSVDSLRICLIHAGRAADVDLTGQRWAAGPRPSSGNRVGTSWDGGA